VKYNQPFDQTNPAASYVNGNPATNVAGSIPCAEGLEYPQREIVNAITAAGLVPTNGDLTQLSQAIAKTSVTQVAAGAGRLLGPPTVMTASGNWPIPAGTVYAVVEMVGGGGAGTGTSNPGTSLVSLGAPGSAGTFAQGFFTLAQLQAALVGGSIPVTIGAAGAGVSAAAGGNGGTTSFGSLMTAPGGNGGGAPLNAQTPPTVNGNGNVSGAATGAFFSRSGTAPNPSLALSATTGIGAPGGDSIFGAGGYGKSANNSGAAATGYGGGGAGTMTTSGSGSTGGNGSPGLAKIWAFGIQQ
jgi:hypothetical protein